jgi:hypothetical protein
MSWLIRPIVLNFEVVCTVDFLNNFCDNLDFAVLDSTLNNTDYRFLKFLKFVGPSIQYTCDWPQ